MLCYLNLLVNFALLSKCLNFRCFFSHNLIIAIKCNNGERMPFLKLRKNKYLVYYHTGKPMKSDALSGSLCNISSIL